MESIAVRKDGEQELTFNPRTIWNNLTPAAQKFIEAYENRQHIETVDESTKRALARADLEERMNTPYVCPEGHRFLLRNADRAGVGRCPVCHDPHIRIAKVSEGLTRQEQAGKEFAERMKEPLASQGGPVRFDPDNDPELRDEYSTRNPNDPDQW